jgi:alpha,alpha-trehalase
LCKRKSKDFLSKVQGALFPSSAFRSLFVLILASCSFTSVPAECLQAALPSSADQQSRLKPILDYISSAWDSLTRSTSDCQSVVDPKIKAEPVLYLPADFAEPVVLQKLARECNVQVEHLPKVIHHLGEIDANGIQSPGLLYLENKYVVPGGRFNEMYGWDSYFIIRGLLRSGRIELARGMVDNFFFEVEHYGAMLNANRTYYLTRSQQPFLSSMFVEVYDELQKSGHPDLAWAARAYADIEKDYDMWNRDPHRAGDTGLSRYYDFGEGPPAEAVKDETGSYQRVAMYFFFHPADADSYIVENSSGTKPMAGDSYALQVCDADSKSSANCAHKQEFKLSADYYKGDRSLRESGFDVSSRFGPFGAATHHYAPVCLNSLLYKTEKDMEQISHWLGRKADSEKWHNRAEQRRQLIFRYLWNKKAGMFYDYDFVTQQMSSYRYATTFYPLWTGLATPEQAKRVAQNLVQFEKSGGLAMSTENSGAQWDLPYGWANIEMLAVEGLRRYGFNSDADRISYEFLSMVADNFRRDGYIVEKYNVVTRSSDVHAELGYKMNVVGFGWTNAAFLELLHDLPKEMEQRLEQEQSRPLTNLPK